MIFVFDLDDTISRHRNRDFEHAEPIEKTITKIRQLHADGAKIVIYSARGQNSCRGDLRLIEERNRSQVETWLREHEVPYDRLAFGKPLGDVYVDDKGISLSSFWKYDFTKLHGNSGEPVFRAGNRVIKQCRNAQVMADWYKKASEIGISVPTVNSVVLNKIDIEYIDGISGNRKDLTAADLGRLVSQIMLMSVHREEAKCDVGALHRMISERASIVGAEDQFDILHGFFAAREMKIQRSASFCHGDFTLSNTIFVGNEVFLIDPSDKTEMSTFLMDFGKLLFSLDGGEALLTEDCKRDYSDRRKELVKVLDTNEWLMEATAIEAVHWLRMLKYFPRRQPEILRKATEVAKRLR